MNFFNATWLFGLISLFIPILLHLQKRKIKTIDWAAVRFLKTSIVNRRRGHTLEYFFLLMCRCLLLVALVLIFARPWTGPDDSILFGFPSLLLIVGIGFVVASLTWSGPRIYRVLFGSMGCILVVLSMVLFLTRQETNSIVTSSSCDAVIVIDGSDSMGLRNEKGVGESGTLFSTAIKEAQQFLDNLPSGSTAAIIVVGDNTSPHWNHRKSNISLLRKQLESLTCPGGANDLSVAIENAKAILKGGANSRQQILVITDDQLTNWQSLNSSEVNISDADGDEEDISHKRHRYGLIAKVLTLPENTVNLAVTNIAIEDQTWRVGESARVDIEVFNGGSELSEVTTIDFQVNDILKQTMSVEPMEPGTRRLIPTDIFWDQPGSVSLGAKVNSSDDVSRDNDFHRALLVRNEIKVLIVGGENTDLETPDAAHYVRLAMNSRQIKMESIRVRELNVSYPFEHYDVIYLCNVRHLTNALAERIAEFAKSGGGLFVLLGEDCDSSFYNAWQCESTQVMPCVLTKYSSNDRNNVASVGLEWASVQHPALKLWFSSGQHDLSDWKFEEYWIANPLNERVSPNSHSRLNFSNGHPFFIEHNLGQGKVVAQTSCPVPRSNNLINRIGFPVWHHVLTRYLAPKDLTDLHQKPTASWGAQIPLATDDEILTPVQSLESNSTAILTNPMGVDRAVPIELDERFWKVDLGDVRYPGLYRLSGPFGKSFQNETWRFSIERDANESDLSKATEDQILSIAKCLGMDLVTDETQWSQVASGVPVKEEWWSLFAYGALVLLVFESIVLRWLAIQRGQTGLNHSFTYLLTFGVTCWLIWWQGWSHTGQLVNIQFSNAIIGIAGLVAGASCIIAATYWDSNSGRTGTKMSWIKFVRLIELGIIGFILLEPMKEQEILNNDVGTTAVLWDRSKSMTLADGKATREQTARKILLGDEDSQSSLLNAISEWNNVRLYQYAAGPELVDYDSLSESDDRWANEGLVEKNEWYDTTKLTDALKRVLDDTPKELLTGVVIISDGCDRSQTPPLTIATTFADQKIPVHAIVIGNRNPVADANVASANAPNQIYSKDQVTVNASLHFDQLNGETAIVRFYRDQELLETKSIPIVSDQQRTTVVFTDIPEAIGLQHYQIKIDPLRMEKFSGNNQRELSVWVTNDRLNVLIVEQRPRWEFRYLKNLFAGRDKNVSLQYVLLAPDRLAGVPDPFPMVASTSRAFDDCEANRLPESELEWLKFDVIVLGDIDPEELDEKAQKSIEKFVSQRGGTLIVISGPNSMPHRYGSTPLYKLLPTQSSTNKLVESNAPYRFRLTNDGVVSPLLNNLSGDAKLPQLPKNSVWERLPILYWRHSQASAKPGATVLAWADDSDAIDHDIVANDGSPNDTLNRKSALIVWHRFGGGKVLQMNFDQTWRLRYWNGDELHHRFWGKVMRWGTEDRLGLGTELVRLGLDKTKYKPQESMVVKVRLVEDQSTEYFTADSVRCVLSRDGETISNAPLELNQNSGGLLQARFTLPKTPGRYRIEVVGPKVDRLLDLENKMGQSVFTEFHIEDNPSDDESNDLVASTAVLAPITNLTGGQLLDANSYQLLMEAILKKTNQNLNQTAIPVWDIWPIGCLLLILVCCEWIIRKRYGLI